MSELEKAKFYFNEGVSHALTANSLRSIPLNADAVTHHENAIHNYDIAIALAADQVFFWNARAHSLLALGKVDEALASLDKAIELAPTFSENYYQASLCFFEILMIPEARSDYEMALSLSDDRDTLTDRMCSDLHDIISKAIFYYLEVKKMGHFAENDALGLKIIGLTEFAVSYFPKASIFLYDLDLARGSIGPIENTS